VSLFYVYVVLCVSRDLATGWSPVQGVLPSVYRIKKLKKQPRPNKVLQSHNNNNNNNTFTTILSKWHDCERGVYFQWNVGMLLWRLGGYAPRIITNKMGSTSDDWIFITVSYTRTLNYTYIQVVQRYCWFTPFTILLCSRTRISCFH
jgi:hypothetical protein